MYSVYTSQGGPGFDHAGICMAHFPSFMQLAEAEAHEEHGIDAAQHPRQLLLIYLHCPSIACAHLPSTQGALLKHSTPSSLLAQG